MLNVRVFGDTAAPVTQVDLGGWEIALQAVSTLAVTLLAGVAIYEVVKLGSRRRGGFGGVRRLRGKRR